MGSSGIKQCSPFPHYNHHLSSPPTHHHQQLIPSTHSLTNNNVHGAQSGTHHYSFASKTPWASSYQSVTRTVKHRPHEPWAHKPWGQRPHKPWAMKPWAQKPQQVWTEKPWPEIVTEKPWVHPTYAPSNSATYPSVTTVAPTFQTTKAPTTISTTVTTSLPPVGVTTTYPTTTVSPPTPSTTVPPTPAPSPDLDLEEDYFPFPALLPLEDIDLPAGPPALLRPSLRLRSTNPLSQFGYFPLGTYLQTYYVQQVNNYLLQ